jgi:hypothetical protein
MLLDLAAKLKTLFAKINHNHDANYEAKNSNIQSHIGSTSNPHATTANQVGLGNVTNNRQVKATASSIDGMIVVWSGTNGDSLEDGYYVESTLTNDTSSIPTSAAVHTAIANVGAGISTGLKPGIGTIAELRALNTTNASEYPDKVMILVEEAGQYRLDRESSATDDGIRIIQPTTGVGRWLRISTSLTDHNLQNNAQGGTTDQKYHLTEAEYNAIPSTATGANQMIVADNPKLSKLTTSGLLNIDNVEVTSAQWTAFTNAINA